MTLNTYVIELVYWHEDHPDKASVARIKVKSEYTPHHDKTDELQKEYLAKYMDKVAIGVDPEKIKSSINVIVKEG
jgi:hypothetical protein